MSQVTQEPDLSVNNFMQKFKNNIQRQNVNVKDSIDFIWLSSTVLSRL